MPVFLSRAYWVKPAFILKLIALCLLLSTACSRNSNELLESGKKYLSEQKYSEATIELRNAVKKDPYLVEARYQLGLAFASLGQFKDASREFSTTLLVAPNHLDAQLRSGYLLLLERKFNEARGKAEFILKSNPTHVPALILLGSSYAGLFDITNSPQELRRGFETVPRLSPPYLDLGASSNFQPQPELAVTAYKKAVSVAPAAPEAPLALANFYLHTKRPKEAEQQLKSALAIEPGSRDVQQALAFFYTRTQELGRAEEIYVDLARQRLQDPAQRIILADFYSETGRFSKAVQVLQELIGTEPQYRIAKMHLGNLFLQQKDLERATQLVDDVLKQAPDDQGARLIRGRVLLARERTADAIADLEIAAKGPSRLAPSRYFLAQAYSQSGDNRKAEAELLAAIQNDASFVEAYVSLAEMKLAAGDMKAGIQYARQALSFNFRFAPARRLLCRAYVRVRDFSGASSEGEIYIKEESSKPVGMYCLGLVQEARGNLSKAATYLKAAFDAEPEQIDDLAALSGIYVKQNRREDALRIINQAISRHPADVAYRWALAQTYLAFNEPLKAEAAFQEALSFNPSGIKGRIALAEFYERTRQSERSTPIYEDLWRSNPANNAIAQRLANLYFNQKAFDRALQVADQLLKADNKNVDAHVLKGRSLLALRKNADGVGELQSAVNANRESGMARFFLGMGYWQDNKPDQAEAAWNETLAIDRQNVQAHLGLAQLKLTAGDPNSAIRYANEALKITPELPEALSILGNAYLMKRDFTNAAREFESLVQQKPGDPAVLDGLGSAYAGLTHFSQAEARFKEALRVTPNRIESLTALANLYLQQGKSEMAIQRLNQQIGNHPEDAVLYRLLGQVFLKQKNYPKAEESYRKAIALDRNDLEAFSLLGQLFMVQNAGDKAINEFENVLRIDSKSISAHIILGSIHEIRNNRDKAQFHYRQALKLDPHSAVASNNLAWLLAESGGSLDEALDLARTAMEKLPKAPNVLDTIGWIYYKRGAYSSAVEFLKRSIASSPRNPVYQYHLGMSYFMLGDREEASASLKQAIGLNPTFSGSMAQGAHSPSWNRGERGHRLSAARRGDHRHTLLDSGPRHFPRDPRLDGEDVDILRHICAWLPDPAGQHLVSLASPRSDSVRNTIPESVGPGCPGNPRMWMVDWKDHRRSPD